MIEIQFKRHFEAAHRLIEGVNANTLCSQPHGHTWEVVVTLEAPTFKGLDGEANVIVPFDEAKKTWHQWIDRHVDHGFFFNRRDPLLEFVLRENPGGRNIVFDGDPTTEVIAATFKSKIDAILKDAAIGLTCSSLVIHETRTNSVRVSGSPRELLPKKETPPWWERSDLSTHDL